MRVSTMQLASILRRIRKRRFEARRQHARTFSTRVHAPHRRSLAPVAAHKRASGQLYRYATAVCVTHFFFFPPRVKNAIVRRFLSGGETCDEVSLIESYQFNSFLKRRKKNIRSTTGNYSIIGIYDSWNREKRGITDETLQRYTDNVGRPENKFIEKAARFFYIFNDLVKFVLLLARAIRVFNDTRRRRICEISLGRRSATTPACAHVGISLVGAAR
ncbi:hypothetical protein PUN28_015354 [Cardiocondyla obscurior]|uniref:Uncharacterized protein n=1 Tax=Cardiocondyla obscurior TaxID=286306 RepID=A0AAW2EXU8_9HYME